METECRNSVGDGTADDLKETVQANSARRAERAERMMPDRGVLEYSKDRGRAEEKIARGNSHLPRRKS
jgi:hypothetical protein